MSKWRKRYKVHPAADVFPMMPDEELDALSKDIKAHGLREPITFSSADRDSFLLDGRNRLEAAERVGYELKASDKGTYSGDPVLYIISKNIHRRPDTSRSNSKPS